MKGERPAVSCSETEIQQPRVLAASTRHGIWRGKRTKIRLILGPSTRLFKGPSRPVESR